MECVYEAGNTVPIEGGAGIAVAPPTLPSYECCEAESGFDVRICTIASAPISTHALIGR
jgi:hypothetical protein